MDTKPKWSVLVQDNGVPHSLVASLSQWIYIGRETLKTCMCLKPSAIHIDEYFITEDKLTTLVRFCNKYLKVLWILKGIWISILVTKMCVKHYADFFR